MIFQKMDWRLITGNEGGLRYTTVSYTLHLKWFKMQFSISCDYKKNKK